MQTLKQLAEQINNNLHTITIKDSEETRIVWKDEAPEELRTWFQEVSSNISDYGFTELDECYTVLEDLCYIISEAEENSDLEQEIYSHEWAYTSNYDLLQWVQENTARVSEVDEALEQGSTTLIGAITDAMHRHRTEYAHGILNAMNEKLEGAK